MKKKPDKPLTQSERTFLTIASYVQPIAFRNVLEGNVDYQIRYIQRWFSEKFNKDIDEVEAMDPYKMLLHFFEHQYENLEEIDRDETHAKLIESDEERQARLDAEQDQRVQEMMADEELLRMVKAQQLTDRKKLEDKPNEKKALSSLTESLGNLSQSINQLAQLEDKEGFAFEQISAEELEKQMADLDMSILGTPNES